jgi:hypothetical protein
MACWHGVFTHFAPFWVKAMHRLLADSLPINFPAFAAGESYCESVGDDCEPRINHVGSGAMNVGRRPWREAMIAGQAGCSIASPAFNECEPLHLAGQGTKMRDFPFGEGSPLDWQAAPEQVVLGYAAFAIFARPDCQFTILDDPLDVGPLLALAPHVASRLRLSPGRWQGMLQKWTKPTKSR